MADVLRVLFVAGLWGGLGGGLRLLLLWELTPWPQKIGQLGVSFFVAMLMGMLMYDYVLTAPSRVLLICGLAGFWAEYALIYLLRVVGLDRSERDL